MDRSQPRRGCSDRTHARRRRVDVNLYRTIMVALAVLVAPVPAFAHTVGTSYLNLSQSSDAVLDVQLDLNLRDAELAVGVDANEDGAITWRELTAARSAI